MKFEPQDPVLSLEHPAVPLAASLGSLLPAGTAAAAQPVLQSLAKRGIVTGADLLGARQSGFVDLSAAEHGVVEKLAAHASLGLTLADPAEREAVIDAGFTSVRELAATSPAKLRERLGAALDPARIDSLASAAAAQSAFLDSVGFGLAESMERATLLGSERACSCEDCQAATSPLAYLYDLISYIGDTVQMNLVAPGGVGAPAPLEIRALSELLHQPLSDLLASCAAVQTPVHQARLCIEALRSYLATAVAPDADLMPSPFALPIEFVIAADVDADGRDELVIAFRGDLGSWLQLPDRVLAGVWVMDFDPITRKWSHLAAMPDGVGAAFLLDPDLVIRELRAGDVDGDGRDEIIARVGRYDGGVDPTRGKNWLWIMDLPAATGSWQHLNPNVFTQTNSDLSLEDGAVQVVTGDVDGDGKDEIIVAVVTQGRPNAFWVFELESLATGLFWQALSPGIDVSLPAFECDPPTAGYTSYPTRLVAACDINQDGRDEVIAYPDGPGRIGGVAWVMAYTPPANPGPGVVGIWQHLDPSVGLINADLPDPSPLPAAVGKVVPASTRGLNSQALLLAMNPGGLQPPDLNLVYEVRYDPNLTPPWADPVEIDCSAQPNAIDLLFAADVDGDLADEVVAVIHSSGRRAAWIMDRKANGTWAHLSPIPNHALGADLEWAGSEQPLKGAFAADIDRRVGGSLNQELVFYGTHSSQIWVVQYDSTSGTWRHATPALASRLDAPYLLAAYRGLLAEVGTSFEELRAARGASADDRTALAARLGVPGRVVGAARDTLDQLLAVPSELTEAKLEELFGLVDTTRDPLSFGPVRNDPMGQVPRFSLDGVVWSTNPYVATVGREGELKLTLAAAPGAKIRATVTRPDGTALATGLGDKQSRVRLTSMPGESLSGWVDLEYQADTSDIELGVLPKVVAWRLDALRGVWDTQDWPDNPFLPSVVSASEPAWPLIDPDVLGVDDFRVPFAKVNAGDADAPFDVWLARRAWVDGHLRALDALGPDAEAALASLRPPAGGAGSVDYPWDQAPAVVEFAALVQAITGPDRDAADQARELVRSRLWLPPDAFVRLEELRAQRALAGALSDAEWRELRDILLLALKRRSYESWRNDETAAAIQGGPDAFVPAPRSPVEGPWPPVLTPGTPLIDPELLTLADVPSGEAGALAAALVRERARALRSLAAALRSARAAGLESMLVSALGPANVGTNWRDSAAALLVEFESGDAARIDTATTVAASDFGLDPASFRRLATFSARLAAGQSPNEAEWLDLTAVLTTAHKRKVVYASWLEEEQALGDLVTYFRARRAALPKWRVSIDQRLAFDWQLAQLSKTPVVDPDRFSTAWLRSRGFNEPAATLYAARRAWETARVQAYSALQLSGSPLLAQFDDLLRTALFPASALPRLIDELRRRREARDLAVALGVLLREVFDQRAADIPDLAAALAAPATRARAQAQIAEELWLDPVRFARLATLVAADPATLASGDWSEIYRTLAEATLVGRVVALSEQATRSGLRTAALLAPLGLSARARSALLDVRRLAAVDGPVLDSEWQSAFDIALRAEKQRRFGRWQVEERATGEARRVRLGPDSFVVPADADTEDQPSEWLVPSDELQRFRDLLEARTGQHDDVAVGVLDAVNRVEQATLPLLRDALLTAIVPPDTDAATWASRHFLVDTQAGGCQTTTRAAHAINTLLALLWSLRLGQLAESYPQLGLEAPNFDRDWPWIGSYATWRSATLVRLYPENIVRPTLRRHQSPAFAAVLDELRSGRELTAPRARQLAAGYATYFRDVCSLDLSRLMCARVDAWARPGDALGTRTASYDFLFAASDASGKIYFSTLELGSQPARPGYEQSFWTEVTALEGTQAGLVGTATYRPHGRSDSNQAGALGWVYLFALTQDLDKVSVVFVRFNLVTGEWESQATLDSPANLLSAELVVGSPSSPPRLLISAGDPTSPDQFVGTLNNKGTGWDTTGLVPVSKTPWVEHDAMVAQPPRQLLAVKARSDGIADLAVVPVGGGRIEFYRFNAQNSWDKTGATTHVTEDGGRVCSGDFDADGEMEIAWTLPLDTTKPLWRTTAVFIEKRNSANGLWTPQAPDPSLPPDVSGASALATQLDQISSYLVSGDVNQQNGAEILLGVRDHTETVTRGQLTDYTGSAGSFWAIERQGQSYRKNSAFGYGTPDPDDRNPYEINSNELGVAVSFVSLAFDTPADAVAAGALAVIGDFDGDSRDELVVFLAPIAADRSRGNDFWTLDKRAADGKLKPLGNIDPQNLLGTAGDLSSDSRPVVAALAADIDGDGRQELIAFPSADAVGSPVWVAAFRPGGGADPAVGGSWVSLPTLASGALPVSLAVALDLDGDGADELVLFSPGKSVAWKFQPSTAAWQQMAPLTMLDGKTVVAAAAGPFVAGGQQLVVAFGAGSGSNWEEREDGPSYDWAGSAAIRSYFTGTATGANTKVIAFAGLRQFDVASPCSHDRVKPIYAGSGAAWLLDDTLAVDLRRARSQAAFDDNVGMPSSVMTYLWEAFYDLPLSIALQLQRSANFTEALGWFRLIYDYTQPPALQRIFYGLVQEQAPAGPTTFDDAVLEWLSDPLDVHAIASTRPNTYTRATLLLIIRCLLDDADAEFSFDTAESIERARLLYQNARELLASSVLDQAYADCSAIIGFMAMDVPDPALRPSFRRLAGALSAAFTGSDRVEALNALRAAADAPGTTPARLQALEATAASFVARAPLRPRLGEIAARADDAPLLSLPAVARSLERVGTLAAGLHAVKLSNAKRDGVTQPFPVPLFGLSQRSAVEFCVSPNPVLRALRLHAELNLYKIRTCRNIGGMKRTLDFYSAATDQQTGLPAIGAGGDLILPGTRTVQPTPYRYQALIERAKDLARTAQQLEGQMLAALERRDNEAYALLQARQSVSLARANVRLGDLQVKQAEDRVMQADLQATRAQTEAAHYAELLEQGESDQELEALALLAESASDGNTAVVLKALTSAAYAAAALVYAAKAYMAAPDKKDDLADKAVTAGIQSLSSAGDAESSAAQAASTRSQIAAMRAGFARTRQDWQIRQRLAAADVRIAQQGSLIESDGVQIAEQGRTISQLQTDNAEQLVDFLHNKFTSVELYDWMSRILEQTYASVLQQATATARLAASQLAFERQDQSPPSIARDYWSPPVLGDVGADGVPSTVDRRGLTGAERLLSDLGDLDQYAFETNRRKLQLTKTLSLAQLAPLDLAALRESGVLTLSTPSSLFDADFPGHYLRLIKRVSVSFIAIVPPTEGVHATLSASGTSRVVVGPDIFQAVTLRREPQSVVLTSPVGSTGTFTFETQQELLNPFEFEGVDTTWQLELPKAANRFDFDTIADVVITLDYTALSSDDYRQTVIRTLDRHFDGEHVISLRNDFPDAYWDLNNPDQSSTPLIVGFATDAGDFPPQLEDLEITELALVVVASTPAPRALSVRLSFAETPASPAERVTRTPWLAANPVEGVISTRRGNAAAWLGLLGKRPVGSFQLSLGDTDEVRDWIAADAKLDLLLVISFRGRTPPWPA